MITIVSALLCRALDLFSGNGLQRVSFGTTTFFIIALDVIRQAAYNYSILRFPRTGSASTVLMHTNQTNPAA